MKHILCYGDSNTWGYNSETDRRFLFHQRWTGRLTQLLSSEYRIIEEGLCGRTTAYELPLEPNRNGIKQYPIALASADPIDLVIVMLGTNDRRRQLAVSPEESALALESYIHITRAPDLWRGHQIPEMLFVSPPEINRDILKTDVAFYYDQNSILHSRQLKTVYQELSKRCHCHFTDAAEYCVPGPDCVHLNEEGHHSLAKAMALKIQEIFA